jgi:hypothetical protein
MTRIAPSLLLLVIVAVAVPTFCDDQQKAKKETTKITAMATDPTGRRIVSISMADMLGVKWNNLVEERRQMGLNYGSLFIAHQLVSSGSSLKEIEVQLKAGKTLFQVGDDLHCNWKQIADRAKKLNSKIDENLYKHFLHEKKDQERDNAENYNVMYDGVKADNEVAQADIEQAQDRYLLWRNQAGPPSGDGRLSTSKERAAYYDHARSGGPHGTAGSTSGGVAPAAGGLPPQ